jgi:hypothetical protein
MNSKKFLCVNKNYLGLPSVPYYKELRQLGYVKTTEGAILLAYLEDIFTRKEVIADLDYNLALDIGLDDKEMVRALRDFTLEWDMKKFKKAKSPFVDKNGKKYLYATYVDDNNIRTYFRNGEYLN